MVVTAMRGSPWWDLHGSVEWFSWPEMVVCPAGCGFTSAGFWDGFCLVGKGPIMVIYIAKRWSDGSGMMAVPAVGVSLGNGGVWRLS